MQGVVGLFWGRRGAAASSDVVLGHRTLTVPTMVDQVLREGSRWKEREPTGGRRAQ
jgi:hypothetical protein